MIFQHGWEPVLIQRILIGFKAMVEKKQILPEKVDFVVKNWLFTVELLKPLFLLDSNPPLLLPPKSLKLFFTKLLFTKLLPLLPLSSKFGDEKPPSNDFFGFFTGLTMVNTGWLKLVIGSDGVKSAEDDVSCEPCGWRACIPPLWRWKLLLLFTLTNGRKRGWRWLRGGGGGASGVLEEWWGCGEVVELLKLL